MSVQEIPAGKRNHLLAALMPEEYGRLEPDLESVELRLGDILIEPGEVMEHVYFPASCIVSMINLTADGDSTQLAMVGREGMLGVALAWGSDVIPCRAVVQSSGVALRLRSELFRWELDQRSSLQRQVLRYSGVLMAQIGQIAVCNQRHTMEQRFCRWLLCSLDRLDADQLNVTQMLLASLLGVRREAITVVAGKLQREGLIHYSRGNMAVLDRAGLHARCCECHAVLLKQASGGLMSPTSDAVPRHPRLNPQTLRLRAELRLQSTPRQEQGSLPDVHELQVHQIELEMQNEELNRAFLDADALNVRFADIYDFSPVAYVSVDSVSVIRQINLAGAILLGIQRSVSMRHRFRALITPDSLPVFNHFLEQVLDGRARQSCKLDLLPLGRSALIKVEIEAVADESGKECRMVVSDVTAREALVMQLKESQEFLRTLVHSLPDMVLAMDSAGCVTYFRAPADPLVANLLPAGILGKTLSQVLPVDVAETLVQVMADVKQTQCARHLSVTLPSGEKPFHFDITLSPIFDGLGIAVGYLCVAHDVTAERLVQAREGLLISALEAVGSGVVITDTQSRIEWSNPAFQHLTGYTRGEMLARRPADLLGSGCQSQSFYEDMWRTIIAGLVWHGELVNTRKDGEVYHAELTIAPVFNAAGEIRHFVGIQHNIDERKEFEQKLRNLATTDSLTGLPNRRYFFDRMEQALARIQRHEGQGTMLLMFDLDHFKAVNDCLGHAAGDSVLQHFSGLLSAELRKVDTAGRIGGEEFAVLLPDSDTEAARVLAERIRARVEAVAAEHCGKSIPITVSVGIAEMNPADAGIEVALARADRALYQAKESGRNRVSTVEVQAC